MTQTLVEKDRADEEADRYGVLGLEELAGIFGIRYIDKKKQRTKHKRGHDGYSERQLYVKDQIYKSRHLQFLKLKYITICEITDFFAIFATVFPIF